MTQASSHQATAAAMPLAPGAEAQINQYLTFILGAETFALGILAIKEIIEYSSLTDVPMMPPYVRGVINLRGAVVPVIDLAVRFGRASAPVTKRTCIVIIEIMANEERQVIGIVVDAVNEVLDIPAADIEPPPAFGAGIRTDFILGMGKVHNKFVIVLDVNHVLAFDELAGLAMPAA
ncbi:chemotaxis protein CheW [Steroidobacter agaridevorans]|uniref:Chemotaxis protein CheW n=1 Tax=Steroidobacter agaridevorans TaxID=2695856 RepID=A0A829YF20_9GAMM|nr:chemotaxis protein CheW [Steroidobacter agaridevorans]GFE81864.1 chemotaxis protein CheW [Steroidobacter agaridevorans]GFE90608.1 chemotaxis protein CheW [Steroidobacter agaridevorans]